MQFDALPRDAWIVLGVAIVLVGAVIVYAIATGRAVSLVLKKGTSHFNLGVGKKPDSNTSPASSGSTQNEVLRNSNVSRSDVRVHIGNVTGDKHD